MYSVILCGGSGTRLWPLSRKSYPKQFLKLYSENSLLQETFLRMQKVMPAENIFFITNKENYYNVFNQIKNVKKDFNKDNVLIEPASLNTAPAISFAIKHLLENVKIDPLSPISFLPSDHYIEDEKLFQYIIKNAMDNVDDQIGTIGITPTKPETGYGYIKKGEKLGSYYNVLEFVEKPNKETAEIYLKSGGYVWNAGMYIFNSKTFVREIKEHSPEIYNLLVQDFPQFIENFHKMPDTSIDFAISEKSKKVITFEGNFGWNDIGSFDNLSEIKNAKKSKHISFDSKNIYAHSANDRLIVTLGVNDLNIIESNDSILIQRKGESENVKKVVEHLKKNDYHEINDSLVSYRPWGSYEILINTPSYKVKKIVVYPGSKLSLQSHHHRAEHWVVVKGMAKIVNGDNILNLLENESTFIPSLAKHRLENPGKINLEIIEVQTGNYLEEDDITRYDDDYKRENI